MDADSFPRINRVIVTGFLQQDPELRHTPSGVAVASFRVRSGRMSRDRRGAPRETISYFTVVVWQELAQRVCREAKNGQGIYVEGFLHSRSFVAASGERKTVVEIYADSVEVLSAMLPVREGRAMASHPDGARPDEPMEAHEEMRTEAELADGDIPV